MSAANFPSDQYFIILSQTPQIVGKISFTDYTNFDLSNIQVWLQKVGAHAVNERFRISVYADRAATRLLYSSDWVSVTDIDSITSSNWYGYVTFDFDYQPINTYATYYIGIETENYTKDGDVHYWGIAIDWPFEINTHVEIARSAAFSIIGAYK
jgi:hypothetical protein